MNSRKNSSGRRQPVNRKSSKSGQNSQRKVQKDQKVTSNNIPKQNTQNTGIRLNKYIANAGICSRRDADTFISAGSATVNGKVITEMGYRVKPTDEVRFDNVLINQETKRYVLLNKPKNYITTMEDDRGRKTVMDIIAKACKERVYPVGRLDRDTTGLLLFTNDGELAKKLTHPKHNVKKLYHATLDKKLTLADLQAIADNPEIEGRKVFVDDVSYVQGMSKNEVGIEIHSGRNRIIRKIFAHFGYKVVKLDRVIFAGLTKRDLQRGYHRHLTQQEVINIKNI